MIACWSFCLLAVKLAWSFGDGLLVFLLCGDQAGLVVLDCLLVLGHCLLGGSDLLLVGGDSLLRGGNSALVSAAGGTRSTAP